VARIPVEPIEITDDEIEAALSEVAMVVLPETIVVLNRCTLVHQSLMRNGLGIEIKFLLPLSEKEKLPDLMNALQRSVTVTVQRSKASSL
jgi:hypothetical protein